jgi:hypothetical protein
MGVRLILHRGRGSVSFGSDFLLRLNLGLLDWRWGPCDIWGRLCSWNHLPLSDSHRDFLVGEDGQAVSEAWRLAERSVRRCGEVIVRTQLTEKRLVDVLMHYLRNTYPATREVRHYENSIDVVALVGKRNEVWAIEVKTSAWPRALSQAIVNLSASHRSYVALYAKNIHRIPSRLLAEFQVGLIAVGTKWGDVRIIRKAPRSPYMNPYIVKRLRASLLKQRR